MSKDRPEAGSPTAIVDVSALTRTFGTLTAVDHVTLTIDQAEIFGLIGPNGAGKSTLIKMLTTLLPPTLGTARIAGYDIVSHAAEVRRHIGYVPQLLSADGSLTAYENMMLSARLYGVPRRERPERITRILAHIGLAEAAHHLVASYSGGMIRRLEIAQSLLHRPAVLFLDEPTVWPRSQRARTRLAPFAGAARQVPQNHDRHRTSHGRDRRVLRSPCTDRPRPDRGDRHAR
jgi:ABC-2 type transport system ATP-binding protein